MAVDDGRIPGLRISFWKGNRGVTSTSDRHGGLSGEPWPDRIINYDGEFVRSLYNPRQRSVRKKKKKEKRM